MYLKILFLFIIFWCKVWSQEYGENFNAIGNMSYNLSIFSANSQRIESTYFEPASGQLIVKGSINTYYPETMSTLIVDYVADKNGYRASFKISKSLPPSNPFTFESRLSAYDLKSLAG